MSLKNQCLLFAAVQQRMALVEWINTKVPNFYMSVKASDEELRASLLDGDILGHILQRLRYSSIDEVRNMLFIYVLNFRVLIPT